MGTTTIDVDNRNSNDNLNRGNNRSKNNSVNKRNKTTTTDRWTCYLVRVELRELGLLGKSNRSALWSVAMRIFVVSEESARLCSETLNEKPVSVSYVTLKKSVCVASVAYYPYTPTGQIGGEDRDKKLSVLEQLFSLGAFYTGAELKVLR